MTNIWQPVFKIMHFQIRLSPTFSVLNLLRPFFSLLCCSRPLHHASSQWPLNAKEEVSRWFSTCQGNFGDPRCCPDAGQQRGAGRCPSDLQLAVKSHGKKGERVNSKLHLTEWSEWAWNALKIRFLVIVFGFPLMLWQLFFLRKLTLRSVWGLSPEAPLWISWKP